MNIGDIIRIICLWNYFGFVLLLLIPYTRHAPDLDYIFNPIYIYKRIKTINWFGCLILTTLFNILCPILSIGFWFYKLCTCGRR